MSAAPVVALRGGARPPGSILFLCGQNAIRSPMAEALAAFHLPPTVLVRSAGLRTGTRDPFVDAVIAEAGLPVIPHDPHGLDEVEDGLFDVIVALTPEALERASELARTAAIEVEHWPIDDPSLTEGRREQVMDAYRAVRDELERRIIARFGSHEGVRYAERHYR